MKKKISRRKFTTTVAGLAAAGLSGIALAGSNPALAAPADKKASFKPPDTTISNLGFDDKKIANLTDAAKKITKKDLAKLQKWIAGGKKGDAPLKLTEKDLDSVNAAWKAYKEKLARISPPVPATSCAAGGCGCCCTCR